MDQWRIAWLMENQSIFISWWDTIMFNTYRINKCQLQSRFVCWFACSFVRPFDMRNVRTVKTARSIAGFSLRIVQSTSNPCEVCLCTTASVLYTITKMPANLLANISCLTGGQTTDVERLIFLAIDYLRYVPCSFHLWCSFYAVVRMYFGM